MLTPIIEQSAPRAHDPVLRKSDASRDVAWDDFLSRTPLGHYQQSTMWAAFKATEGWRCERVIATEADTILGGYQLLWKNTRLGRIGFVYKGPVVVSETQETVEQLQFRLRNHARDLGLRLLVVQAPDDSGIGVDSFQRLGFLQSNPTRVIEATYLINVGEGMEIVRARMSASLRKHVRKAQRMNVCVTEGTEADLPRFFELMTATCRRQNTSPSPGSADALRRLWRIFSPANAIRMTFASKAGLITSGQLSLRFGDRVTLWKKGWDGSNGNWHANELLEDESLAWAHAVGAKLCDFCSMNRSTADQLLSGAKPGDSTSRDIFNLRFGGNPKLLPRVVVFLANPLLRWGYRNIGVRCLRWCAGATASS